MSRKTALGRAWCHHLRAGAAGGSGFAGAALRGAAVFLVAGTVCAADAGEISDRARATLAGMGIRKGVCAVLGLPEREGPGFVTDLAAASDLVVYFQSPDRDELAAVRRAAEAAGLLGTRVFVDGGGHRSVHLADNLAGAVWASPGALGPAGASREEILRVLHPGGRAVLDAAAGRELITKPFPRGTDAWSHPYHGPDNNPFSTDEIARHPYLTQFLGYPLFGCISEVTVGAGGRLFKAFGHIAFKTAQNEVLNKLYGINAYNGAILWTRPLKEGFMIHRNTMIATPEALYLADDESCKLIDPATGRTRGEIVPPVEAAEGMVWKWMALEKGTLFALLGGVETRAAVRRARVAGFGHWPWGMWQGYDYKGGAGAFGFGRNLFAIDPETKRVLWHHREEELLDSRGVCMRDGRIYSYAPGRFLACLSAKDGTEVWRTSDRGLLAAIGPTGRAQHYVQGFSTSAYIKCNGEYLFFAGPQRPNLVAVSSRDGKLAWSRKGGNYQLVLRDDALYAVGHGPRGGESVRYEYGTWKSLGRFLGRRACTRATGSLDSVFYRAAGGTIRYDPASGIAEHIAPMRPPCHDGVIISDGMLYWGPWICGCQLALYGNIALAPAGRFDFKRKAREEDQLVTGRGDLRSVRELHGQPRTSGSTTTCGDMAFTAGSDGVVKAREAGTGKLVWKAYTSGGIRFPPAVWKGRLYVGSNDGRVYAFEAATGRLLWRFRAAPAERWIPVYGKLMSTWPVAGGVAVEGGRVYAAAGIAHYDGTHVYALDAVTGRIEWHNGSSGALAECGNGVSLQGRLRVADGKLTFCGGNAYPEAAFDLETGRCLTAPHGPRGERPTTFYAVQDYLREIRERRGREMARKFSGRLREIQSGRFFTVDLRAHCNRPLAQKQTRGRRPNDLRVLPVGRQTFRGVTFDIVDQARNGGNSQIRLLSSRHQKDLPREVKGIALGGRKAARLYFFHTMEWGDVSPQGSKVGEYVVRYQGRNDSVTVPIVSGGNIRDWWGPDGLPAAHVGWFGHNGMSWVGVYICVWRNPRPDEAIASVDFVTHDLGPALSLIAITAEE